MHSPASLGIPPELPAAREPLLGDDDTARLPLPVSMLPPLAFGRTEAPRGRSQPHRCRSNPPH